MAADVLREAAEAKSGKSAARKPPTKLCGQEAYLRVIDGDLKRTFDLFEVWDTNDDGCIGQDELKKALASAQDQQPSAEEFRRLWLYLDPSCSGKIPAEELHAAMVQQRAAKKEWERQLEEKQRRAELVLVYRQNHIDRAKGRTYSRDARLHLYWGLAEGRLTWVSPSQPAPLRDHTPPPSRGATPLTSSTSRTRRVGSALPARTAGGAVAPAARPASGAPSAPAATLRRPPPSPSAASPFPPQAPMTPPPRSAGLGADLLGSPFLAREAWSAPGARPPRWPPSTPAHRGLTTRVGTTYASAFRDGRYVAPYIRHSVSLPMLPPRAAANGLL